MRKIKGLITVIMLFVLAGCAHKIDYSLPEDPIEFNTSTFV